jgi:hypothetical protein
LVLAVAILLAGALAVTGQGLVSKLEILLQLAGSPVAASAAVLSEQSSKRSTPCRRRIR